MNWETYWWWSAILLAVAVVASAFFYIKKIKHVNPFYILTGGVALSCAVLIAPIYLQAFEEENGTVFKAISIALHDTIQFFTADSSFDLIETGAGYTSGWLQDAYSLLGTVLILLAPILTFTFVLSFFKGITAWLRYTFHLPADTYVFSEINARSVSLAESIRADSRRHIILFTNVPKDEEKIEDDLMDRVSRIHAILYKKDISLIQLRHPFAGKELRLFALCENESESLSEALQLIAKYKSWSHTSLYLFSHSIESELMLNNVDKGQLKVRRIHPIHSLVNHILATEGIRLFRGAAPCGETEKRISALVIGLGALGTELVKALSWYGQMDHYSLAIHGFDTDETARERLLAACPELLSEQYNGVYKPGEAYYDIHIHTCDVRTATLRETIREIGTVTCVFISLGDDSLNVRTAVDLRVLFEQMRIHPDIFAVVSDPEKSAALSGARDRDGTPYDIRFIGDQKTIYSRDVLLNSALEQEALELHKRYNGGDPYGFYEFEYNYKSSTASVIHFTARKALHIPGADKAEEALTERERETIEALEHKRWNAYMRSEGYIYSGSKDKSSRNNLGKMHHNLVEFEELDDEDKRKDSRVGTR